MTNDNIDLGTTSAPGQYRLSDDAHAKLLDELSQQKFAGMTEQIRTEILGFFANTDTPFELKKHKKAWARLQTELEALRNSAQGQHAGL